MITLTEPAQAKVRELIAAEGQPELALRVSVRPGGCSGFSYEMDFDDQIDELADIVSDFDGVRVAVDRESLSFLEGATVDYADGLQGAGFKVNNPNVTRSCGCGQSFS